jgi:small-conductance mechanosensitive channel/CRP-like cAMP-binding protein
VVIARRVRAFVLALLLLGLARLLIELAAPAMTWLYPEVGADELALFDRLALGAFWLAAAWLVCVLIDLVIWQALVERRTAQPAPRLLVTLVRVLIFFLVIALVTNYLFEETFAALLLSSGAVGIVAGFALQRTISDFFTGVALNLEGPFKIGDWIEVDGVVGRVAERTWRAVHLVTLDQVSVILPNSTLAERRFLNYNAPAAPFRATLPIALEYELPPADAKRALLAAVRAAPGVLAKPSPDVLLTAFGNDGVEYEVRFYIFSYAQMQKTRDAVACSISRHLWQAGMSVPYPKRDVYFARMPQRHLDHRTDRQAILARVDLFATLQAEEIETLAATLETHNIDKGAQVVRQDEQGASLFLVVDGLFEVQQERNGQARPIARLGPGQCFGEMSLLSGAPRSATVTAVTAGTLFELQRDGILPVLNRRPELAETLGRILVEHQGRNAAAGADDTPSKADSASWGTAELVRRIRLFFNL